MLEIGAQYGLTAGAIVRPYIRAGVTWRDTDTFVTSASFAGAPGSQAFDVTSSIDKTTLDVATGIDLISAGDTALRVEYRGQFGDTTTQNTGSAKLSFKF